MVFPWYKKKILQKNVKRDAYNIENIEKFEQNIYNSNNEEDKKKIKSIASEINKRNPKIYANLHNSSLIKEELEAWADSEGFFSLVENNEQAKENVGILTFNQRQKRMLNGYSILFDLLEDVHLGALMNVVKIICKEDELDKMNFGEEFTERNRMLGADCQKFESSKNGNLFKKIYNLIRSNDIEEWAFPLIKELKEKYNSDLSKVKLEFQRQWNARLAKHPTKVWISSPFDFEVQRVEEELVDRLNMKKPKVYLYSRGHSSNKYSLDLVDKLKHEYKKEYKVSLMRRTIAKQKCLCHIFNLVK